jgi:tRNA nucleotidyltransferase (CCA-adding enzyme)
LLVNRSNIKSLTDAAELRQSPEILADQHARPSQIVKALHDRTETALLAVWLVTDDAIVKSHLANYMRHWRHVRSSIDGNTLQEMGLPPGPEYRVILSRLLTARLDGEINSREEEHQLALRLVQELS